MRRFQPRISRIYTDEAVAQGGAWASQAALPNQALWQASLPTRLFQKHSLASRAALLFRALREINNCQELALRKSTGHARPDGLAEFLKRHLQACLRVDLQKGRTIRAAN